MQSVAALGNDTILGFTGKSKQAPTRETCAESATDLFNLKRKLVAHTKNVSDNNPLTLRNCKPYILAFAVNMAKQLELLNGLPCALAPDQSVRHNRWKLAYQARKLAQRKRRVVLMRQAAETNDLEDGLPCVRSVFLLRKIQRRINITSEPSFALVLERDHKASFLQLVLLLQSIKQCEQYIEVLTAGVTVIELGYVAFDIQVAAVLCRCVFLNHIRESGPDVSSPPNVVAGQDFPNLVDATRD